MSLILSPAPHVRTKNTTQRLMLNVVISLLPCAAAGIYYFGLRAAIVLAVSVVSAVLAELVWQKLAIRPCASTTFPPWSRACCWACASPPPPPGGW